MNQRVLLKIILSLSFAPGITGCAGLQDLVMVEKPKLTANQSQEESLDSLPPPSAIPAEHMPALSWMDKYGIAASFTPQERQARLVTINTMMQEAATSKDHLNLAMEQATILSVNEKDHTQWRKALEILNTVGNDKITPELSRYKSWLTAELDRRLENYKTLGQLNKRLHKMETTNKALETEVSQLKEQIDALTNIEQNLTEKKATQTEP